ncbi:MAG TPA: DNA-processing protein DprA [Euzebya sp.]|nr:DNA-processing protein DprA [Euzebya sp.]
MKARRIAETFADWAALAQAEPPQLARLGVLGASGWLRAVPEVELPRTVDGSVVGIFDDGYPAVLAGIANPPVLLWVDGMLPADPGIAIVGTRTPTAFGHRVAQRAAREAVAAGHPVISGMSEGIDQAAEQAAVTAGGVVISVVGGGLDQVPPSLRAHREGILANGGAIVSEQPPGTSPTRTTLDNRDRIQSGLAHSVVIAQAGLRGGTIATVRFTLVQGRRLIVPRPQAGTEHARTPASALLLALTDPDGIDPQLLGLTGRHAATVANRRPVADVVAHTGDELATALRQPVA